MKEEKILIEVLRRFSTTEKNREKNPVTGRVGGTGDLGRSDSGSKNPGGTLSSPPNL